MLILEGTDLVGKTTLAKMIVAMGSPFGPLNYRSLGRLPGDWDYKRDYVNRMSHLIVQDRFFVSELVYGKIDRGYTALMPHMVLEIETALKNVGGLTLIITASEEVITKRHKLRGDDLYDLKTILKANDGFREFAMKRTGSDYYLYNIEEDHMAISENSHYINLLRNTWHNKLRPFFEQNYAVCK